MCRITRLACSAQFVGVLQVAVCQGALKSLKGVAKERIADFVHGRDGFGNTGQPAPKVLNH